LDVWNKGCWLSTWKLVNVRSVASNDFTPAIVYENPSKDKKVISDAE